MTTQKVVKQSSDGDIANFHFCVFLCEHIFSVLTSIKKRVVIIQMLDSASLHKCHIHTEIYEIIKKMPHHLINKCISNENYLCLIQSDVNAKDMF